MKRVRGWAVLVPIRYEERANELMPYGNGNQFQFPIFSTRAEALAWKREDDFNRGKIVMVWIAPEDLNVK